MSTQSSSSSHSKDVVVIQQELQPQQKSAPSPIIINEIPQIPQGDNNGGNKIQQKDVVVNDVVGVPLHNIIKKIINNTPINVDGVEYAFVTAYNVYAGILKSRMLVHQLDAQVTNMITSERPLMITIKTTTTTKKKDDNDDGLTHTTSTIEIRVFNSPSKFEQYIADLAKTTKPPTWVMLGVKTPLPGYESCTNVPCTVDPETAQPICEWWRYDEKDGLRPIQGTEITVSLPLNSDNVLIKWAYALAQMYSNAVPENWVDPPITRSPTATETPVNTIFDS